LIPSPAGMINVRECCLVVDDRESVVWYYKEKQATIKIRSPRDESGRRLMQASGVARAMAYRAPYVQVTNAIERISQDLGFREHVVTRPIGPKKKARFLDSDGLRIFVGYCCGQHPKPARDFWGAVGRAAGHLGIDPPADLPIIPTKEASFADRLLAAARGAGFDGERQRWLPRSRRSLDVYFPGQNVVVECDERETHARRNDDDRLRERELTAELRDLWTEGGSLADCAIMRFVPETDDVFDFVGRLLRELFDRDARKARPRAPREAQEE
jgi:hypothetical protein